METVPSVQTTLHALGTPAFQLPLLDMAFHCAIVPLNLMFVRLVQPLKAYQSMLVTLFPIVTLVRPLQ